MQFTWQFYFLIPGSAFSGYKLIKIPDSGCTLPLGAPAPQPALFAVYPIGAPSPSWLFLFVKHKENRYGIIIWYGILLITSVRQVIVRDIGMKVDQKESRIDLWIPASGWPGYET